MACATATQPEMENRTASLPMEVSTLAGSSMFTKQLTAISISAITYMRAMFPEAAYGVRNFFDLDLKVLSETSMCGPACQIVKWVKSSFEALDKKYLRVMMLGIHDKPSDHDKVIESYIFQFTYTNGVSITCNGVEISNSTDAEITRTTAVRVLRNLLLVNQTLEPLPASYYVTMKLLYYDDVTPSNYEPVGFVPADTDTFYFEGEPLTVRVGCVSTPFHSLKLNIKADKTQFNFRDEEPMPSGSIQLQSSGKTENTINLSFEGSDGLDNITDRKSYTVGEPDECQIVDPPNYTNMEKSVNAAEVVAENNVIRCPCGSQQEEGLMIECHRCEYWQHGVCFGAIEELDTPEIHLCDICYKSDNDGFEPKDRDFYELSAISMQALCLWRRALLCVCDMRIVQPAPLARTLQTKRSVAVNIIKKMKDEGYVTTTGTGRGRGRKYANKHLIKEHGIPKYILGTIKDISDDEDVAVEELNEEANGIHVASAPELTTYGLFGYGKVKYQDYKTSHSKKPRCGGEEVRKYSKASTCKSGMKLDYLLNQKCAH